MTSLSRPVAAAHLLFREGRMGAIRFLAAAVLAAGLATAVAAQSRTTPGFGLAVFGGSEDDDVTGRVLKNAGLQKELGVTAAQKEKLKAAIEKQVAMQMEFRAEKLSTEKITALSAKALKVAEELRKIIDDTLTDAQRKRLRQIEIQGMNFAVFGDLATARGNPDDPFGVKGPTVSQVAILKEAQAALKLSDAQKDNIKATVDAFNIDRKTIMKTAGSPGKPGQVTVAEAMKTVEKARKDAWGRIEELLDADQKKTLKDLIGEPSGFGKLRFGG
jgi:Spy/CpxP family protein refolding chaperone